jgi:hypothetical protein
MRNNSKNPYATGWNYPNHSENNGEPNIRSTVAAPTRVCLITN